MKHFPICYILILSAGLMNVTHSAKILGLCTSSSKSHTLLQLELFKELANRGHNVTLVTAFTPDGLPKENLRTILLNNPNENAQHLSIVTNILKNGGNPSNLIRQIPAAITLNIKVALDALYHSEFQKLLSTESFDLLIMGWFGNDFLLGVAAHFKCPSILMPPSRQLLTLQDYVRNPYSPASVPHNFLNMPSQMSFTQRIGNFIVFTIDFLILQYMKWLQSNIYYEHFPSDIYPKFDEVQRNVSLVLTNYHFSQGVVQPNVPGMIEVGGLHIKTKSDVLPETLKQFLDNAPDGAIMFSLGTNILSSHMTLEKLNDIKVVFSKLKQKIIWKYENDTMFDKPDNVMILKWLPQQDILAHPNIKLFISHCGYGGVTESKYYGVPILCIPIFADQFGNAVNVVNEGWGISLAYSNLNELTLSESVRDLLNNITYRKTAKKVSEIFKDRPQSAMETAIFWVEYVLRHNGAKHLQSAGVHLNFIQNNSLDVIAFLLVTFYCIYFVLKFICKKLLKTMKSKLKLD